MISAFLGTLVVLVLMATAVFAMGNAIMSVDDGKPEEATLWFALAILTLALLITPFVYKARVPSCEPVVEAR